MIALNWCLTMVFSRKNKDVKIVLLLFILVGCQIASAQPYTSYFTGNTTDVDTIGQGGICLMGGATEDDNAMIWFLERANEGDVLVLRASGSDGYNDYMFNQLGVTLNSVETIVCSSAAASDETYVQQAIEDAEAIWFAGGDQWDYVSYWRNTAVDSLINWGIQNKGLVVGGTSAGMAIQGEYYFSAENGTVTSATALGNPYVNNVTVDNTPFIQHDILTNTITDTHYDNPDRKGRHVTFLARMVTDNGLTFAQGIACDEYTAVCIDENGIAKVYGGHPTYDDNAYFIRVNCDNIGTGHEPENCTSGNPLDWNRSNTALQVYEVKGTASANNSFDLNDWTSATGGQWESWWVNQGTLNEASSSQIDCTAGFTDHEHHFTIYPNPAQDQLLVESVSVGMFKIYDLSGKIHLKGTLESGLIDIENLVPGAYMLEITAISFTANQKFIKE